MIPDSKQLASQSSFGCILLVLALYGSIIACLCCVILSLIFCIYEQFALLCHRARQMGSDLIYVSGRKRKPGEMNGKSCNLNNCLSQIYPEGVPIPAHELVCIFDADQVANVDFYTKMIPLFDAGDDVGMVLSPQCFHNVNVGADIFNHCNINFWEYAQHGYDAFGFISCTGTNFLTRCVSAATALQLAPWTYAFCSAHV